MALPTVGAQHHDARGRGGAVREPDHLDLGARPVARRAEEARHARPVDLPRAARLQQRLALGLGTDEAQASVVLHLHEAR
eukprot:scaffold83680_cov48-Phaeocystis_antarctica.AAC.1